MEAIDICGLTKTYRELTAVDGLNLTIHPGELFALLGVNGAGKSTTIKMLSGLTEPTAGEARLGGYSVVTEKRKVKCIIGSSPQETAVAPHLTVRENLELMGGLYGFSKEKRRARTAAMTEAFGLAPILGRRAGKLSGGWQRRLSIAMALISEPQILFLDEPTLGLDVLARQELWDLIRSLHGRMTILLTTHYMEEAEELADRIGIMQAGKLLACGTADELKARTGTTSVEKAFIAMVKGENA